MKFNRETCFTAVPSLETGPRSSLREFHKGYLDGIDVSAGLFCIVEVARVAANGLHQIKWSCHTRGG